MTDNFYSKAFAKRSTISFFVITLLLLTCVLRTAVIAVGNYGELQKNQSEYKIKISKLRGTIYDCNMYPITNRSTKTVAAVSPSAKNSTVLFNSIDESVKENVKSQLSDNEPAVFKCHNLSGHGNMNLCTALTYSCNCYFYNLGLVTGAKSVLDLSSALSFGFKIRLADNLSTSSGNLPDLSRVLTDAALANLSIGQGELLLSPVAMLNLYSAIAGDGGYYLPSVVEKTIEDGVPQNYAAANKTRVMSSETAELLREYIKTVITDGTGKEAAPQNCTAAGKTATAQTGRYYENGTEITNSWFCGFFPYENPKYVLVVMSDVKSDVSTASVFAEIADKITELNP